MECSTIKRNENNVDSNRSFKKHWCYMSKNTC